MKRDRKLLLNSIDRFQKSSSTLHLEEYSHCEVPAGCGGVVLRWIDDNSRRPLDLELDLNGEGKLWINGESPDAPWLITPGTCVLAIELRDFDPAFGLVMAAAKNRAEEILFTSQPDGSWRYTTAPPTAEQWKSSDFDDSRWQPLEPRKLPPPKSGDYHRNSLLHTFAQGLGLPRAASFDGDAIWLRKTFEFANSHALVGPAETWLNCFAEGQCTLFFDDLPPNNPSGYEDGYGVSGIGNQGVTSASKRLHPFWGQHVIGVAVKLDKKSSGALVVSMVAARYTDHPETQLVSRAGSSWRVTEQKPPAQWLDPDFDDGSWHATEEATIDMTRRGKMARSDFTEISDTAAEVIAPPANVLSRARRLFGSGCLWYRHVFETKSRDEE